MGLSAAAKAALAATRLMKLAGIRPSGGTLSPSSARPGAAAANKTVFEDPLAGATAFVPEEASFRDEVDEMTGRRADAAAQTSYSAQAEERRRHEAEKRARRKSAAFRAQLDGELIATLGEEGEKLHEASMMQRASAAMEVDMKFALAASSCRERKRRGSNAGIDRMVSAVEMATALAVSNKSEGDAAGVGDAMELMMEEAVIETASPSAVPMRRRRTSTLAHLEKLHHNDRRPSLLTEASGIRDGTHTHASLPSPPAHAFNSHHCLQLAGRRVSMAAAGILPLGDAAEQAAGTGAGTGAGMGEEASIFAGKRNIMIGGGGGGQASGLSMGARRAASHSAAAKYPRI